MITKLLTSPLPVALNSVSALAQDSNQNRALESRSPADRSAI